MQLAARILEFGLLAWFGFLALLLALRMLRRNITISGMLMAEPDAGKMAPERLLQMAAFPIVLFYLVREGLQVDVSAALAAGVRPSLPNIPDNLITLLTGTNSLYLAGKIARMPK
jgi:hypothetical protein